MTGHALHLVILSSPPLVLFSTATTPSKRNYAVPAKRPNLLLIMADQLAGPALPTYGHPVVKAPHLTELANNGVVFESAYCSFPLCAPSRFSLLSGQLPSRIGAYDNAAHFSSQTPTFAHYLRLLGYRAVLAGKMHFIGADQLHGFEERLTTDIYPADFGWTPDWAHPERILEWYHNMIDVVQAGVCEASVDLDYDEEVAFQATRKLYSLVREADDRPFCLVVSFAHPHDPYVMTPEYWDRYRHDEIDMPAVPPISPDQLDAHSRRIWEICATDEYAITEAHIRNARHGYYSSISYIDDKVHQLVQALKATGQYDDTIIIFTSDHGEMLGERGLWYKMLFWEWSARVPLIVHAPKYFAQHRVATNVSTLDLLPTLVALAGGDLETALAAPIDGHNLVPLLQGDLSQAADVAIAEYLAEGAIAPCFMIRRGSYKYIYGATDPELLYDLTTDPTEQTNLANQPAYAPVIEAFRTEVAQRWDVPQLHQAILGSQRQRQLVSRALMTGKIAPWDYQPTQDAAQQYVRNNIELWELMRRTRFPAIETPAPVREIKRYVNLPA